MGIDLQSNLLDAPVGPSRTRMIALGLIAGLVSEWGALLLERRTGLVYSEDELSSLLPCPLIEHLPTIREARGPMADPCHAH